MKILSHLFRIFNHPRDHKIITGFPRVQSPESIDKRFILEALSSSLVKMQVQICLLQSALAELFAQVSKSGTLSVADRYGLMAALLNDSLNEEEKRSIDRLLYSVRKNRLKIVDEISTLS